MQKSFEFEKIKDPRRVGFDSTKLRSHASFWRDNLQLNRECGGREKIRTWDTMI